jgi:hypothetical protein
MSVDPVVTELARLLARGWVRRLAAEMARNDAVSFDESAAICLELPRPKWPCLDREARRT